MVTYGCTIPFLLLTIEFSATIKVYILRINIIQRIALLILKELFMQYGNKEVPLCM